MYQSVVHANRALPVTRAARAATETPGCAPGPSSRPRAAVPLPERDENDHH